MQLKDFFRLSVVASFFLYGFPLERNTWIHQYGIAMVPNYDHLKRSRVVAIAEVLCRQSLRSRAGQVSSLKDIRTGSIHQSGISLAVSQFALQQCMEHLILYTYNLLKGSLAMVLSPFQWCNLIANLKGKASACGCSCLTNRLLHLLSKLTKAPRCGVGEINYDKCFLPDSGSSHFLDFIWGLGSPSKVQRANTSPSKYENDLCELKCLAMHRPTHELWREVREVSCGTFWAQHGGAKHFSVSSLRRPAITHMLGTYTDGRGCGRSVFRCGWSRLDGKWWRMGRAYSVLVSLVHKRCAGAFQQTVFWNRAARLWGRICMLTAALCLVHQKPWICIFARPCAIIVNFFSPFFIFFPCQISNQAASTTARQMKAVLIRAIQGKDPFWSHAANMSTGSGSRCHQVSLVISTTLMGKIPLRHHAPI